MSELRKHHQDDHTTADINTAFFKLYEYLKVDITELKCKICCANIADTDTLMSHVNREHDIRVNFDVPFGVFPYKQNSNDEWVCVYCDKLFSEFLLINRHIGDHFKNLNCEKCGTAFVSEKALKNHNRVVKCYKTNYKGRVPSETNSRNNAHIILQCSTVYPFRIWKKNFNCIFCRVQSIDPNGFRHHMDTRHANYDVTKAFYKRLGKEFLKIDVTNLKCKLCYQTITNLDDLVDHLKSIHQQPIVTNAQLGVLPFALNDGTYWKCAICSNEFPDFVSLSKHTYGHYRKFVCDTCGEGFITESSLLAHTKIPHENKYKCTRCVAAFSTPEERSSHYKSNHPANLYICTYCKDTPRFSNWNRRKRHLVEVHSFSPGSSFYECTTCQKSFKSRSAKYNHMARTHRMKTNTSVRYNCAVCSKSFNSKVTLESHLSKKHYDV